VEDFTNFQIDIISIPAYVKFERDRFLISPTTRKTSENKVFVIGIITSEGVKVDFSFAIVVLPERLKISNQLNQTN
jgi:hypothetical protein